MRTPVSESKRSTCVVPQDRPTLVTSCSSVTLPCGRCAAAESSVGLMLIELDACRVSLEGTGRLRRDDLRQHLSKLRCWLLRS
jgi:hypothetical protein